MFLARLSSLVFALTLAGPALADSMTSALTPTGSLKFTPAVVINPRDFCASCGDGNSHSVSATIGVTTLAGLASYTIGGSAPFSFVSSYPFGVLFNLIPSQTTSSGVTTLNFQSTATIGMQTPVMAAASSGATSIIVGDLFTTADQTAIANGMALGGTGVAAGTTVNAAPSGFGGHWTLSLSAALTGNLTTSSYVYGYVVIPSGAYNLPIIWTSGVNVGDTVTAASGCIPAGTQVDYVNDAKAEIRISKATTANCASKDTLTFTPSWLSKVVAGMTVQGPTGAVANGTTVSSVNTGTGVVTLSQALTGTINPNSSILGNGSPTTAQQVTFYRPFTDSEASALEMDGLALQASINKTQVGTLGGSVTFPEGSSWRLSAPLILPLQTQNGNNQQAVAFGGPSGALNDVTLLVASDFGPDSAALSCGDPSAKLSNARGLYGTGNSVWCNGWLHDLRIQPLPTVNFIQGLRPTWSGVPVAMDGVKQGDRLNWDNVNVSGFRNGGQAAMDHTLIANSHLTNNFCGWRMDDQQTNLHSDDVFDRVYLDNNSQGAMCVASDAYFNGEIRKGYMATVAYAFYCEPGVSAGQCLQGVTITNLNAENLGCGFIQDGGIQDGWVANGGARTLVDVKEVNNFHYAAVSGWTSAVPAGGCQWHAYYDMGYVQGHVIEQVARNEFPQQTNAFDHILRTTRLDAFGNGLGFGGFTMRGEGVYDVVQNAKAFGQNVVGGPNGAASTFWYTGSWRWVTLETSTWKARPMPFIETGATTYLPTGTLVEYSTTTQDNNAGIQRAGQTTGAPFAGVVVQNWSTQNPQNNQLMPIVAFAGSVVPILTTAAATAGEMVIPSGTTYGSAVSTSTSYGPPLAIGMIFQTTGGAGVAYGQLLQGRN